MKKIGKTWKPRKKRAKEIKIASSFQHPEKMKVL